jgi:hygromycin-B 7''-O-kinase
MGDGVTPPGPRCAVSIVWSDMLWDASAVHAARPKEETDLMNAHVLPPTPSLADWPSLRRTHPGWRAALEEICARHGFPASELVPARGGTSVVFTTTRQVIKLYPPFWASGAAAESMLLGRVGGQLGVPTPEVLATGSLDGWPYLAMTRLQGVILADVWQGLAASHRRTIARQLGEILARLHTLPTSGLSAHPVLAERWTQLVTRPVKECVAIHRGHGAPEVWLVQLPAFLERLPPLYPADFTPVLVNGDVHGWHLLVTECDGGWRLAGLFDFDDAMLGWWEYELAVPALSLMAGQPAVLSACVRGFGAERLLTDGGLPRRLMAYALLNRYWGLDFMLQIANPTHHCVTFDDLARALFALASVSPAGRGERGYEVSSC